MNRTGYARLGQGGVNEALTLFRMNIEAYPESFNVYDSYGEALMAHRQYELALKNYTRSVELNPGNASDREKLAQLLRLLAAHTPPTL